MGLNERVRKLIYSTEEARHYQICSGDKATHYENGFVPEAMLILNKNRELIQRAIFGFCDKICRKHNCTEDLPKDGDDIWIDILGKELIDSFLHENKKFKKGKIIQIYGSKIGQFFLDINKLISKTEYTEKLKKMSLMPIKNKNIAPGWISLLREFGIFSPLGNRLGMLSENIQEINHNPSVKEILNEINITLSKDSFTSKDGIQCPAATQVINHFGVCIGLNAGLIKMGIYSKETRISMLNDGTNHFKSPTEMFREYERVQKISN